MRLALVLVLLAACGHDPAAPRVPSTLPDTLTPAPITGEWAGMVSGQPVVLRLDWMRGLHQPEDSRVFLAGGFGTVGPDSLHVTGTLHGDTLRLATSDTLIYGRMPQVRVAVTAHADTLRGTWTGQTTSPVTLTRQP